MIKLVMLVRRRAHMSPDDFRSYWLEKHGHLVRSLTPRFGARRYVQSHTLDTPLNALLAQSRGMGEPFDGIAELWWDSADALLAALGSADGQAANRVLIEDEAHFVDLARSYMFLTEEHTIFEGPAPPADR
jgi:uncharacterized protein (TIGR02118 family)